MRARTVLSDRTAGFSLVELLVAMVIGLVLVGVVSAMLLGSSSSTRARERESDIQTNGRYAVDVLRRTVTHAGFLGVSSLFWPDAPYTATPVANVCDPNTFGQLSQRVRAADDTNPFAATCIPAANYRADTDVLVVRFLSPNPVAGPYNTAAPAAGDFVAPNTGYDGTTLYYHAAYEGGNTFYGVAVPDFTSSSKAAPYFDYQLEEHVYYISPFTDSAAENPQIPALWRLRLGAGPAMVPELVATGIEDMQIRLAQVGMNSSGAYLAPSAVTDWDSVQAVEISLLVRGLTPDPQAAGAQTYQLGGEALTFTDGIPRRVYSTVVQLRN